MIISNLKIESNKVYGLLNVFSQFFGFDSYNKARGFGSDINSSKRVEENIMRPRDLRCLIQGHPLVNDGLGSSIEGLRLRVLGSFQQPRLTPKWGTR